MIARYFRLHLNTLIGSLRRVGSSPLGAVLNVLVIAIALALPAALQILIANAGAMAPAFDQAADLTLYLDLELDEDAARDLAAALGAREDIAAVRFVSKLEGLDELRQRSAFGGALDALSENPLPHVIELRPESQVIDAVDRLAAELGALEQVELVQLDRLWIERLQAILALGRRAANLVTGLLAAAVILVIGNTIRLEINNRRTEIEVLKLVGATDGFIRRPFLYTGLWLGALGAVTAAAMIGIGLWLVAGPVRDLAQLYASDFALSGLGAADLGLLVGGGAVLGWAGAWIAAARHLKAIEPA